MKGFMTLNVVPFFGCKINTNHNRLIRLEEKIICFSNVIVYAKKVVESECFACFLRCFLFIQGRLSLYIMCRCGKRCKNEEAKEGKSEIKKSEKI